MSVSSVDPGYESDIEAAKNEDVTIILSSSLQNCEIEENEEWSSDSDYPVCPLCCSDDSLDLLEPDSCEDETMQCN